MKGRYIIVSMVVFLVVRGLYQYIVNTHMIGTLRGNNKGWDIKYY